MLHIGRFKDKYKCQDLFVGGWKIKNEKNIETGTEADIETLKENKQIETVAHEKYLGDTISKDGYTKTIHNRMNKGQGAIAQIINIVDNIYFGTYHFVAATILRNPLLISRMLFNCETWYSVSIVEIEKLEQY